MSALLRSSSKLSKAVTLRALPVAGAAASRFINTQVDFDDVPLKAVKVKNVAPAPAPDVKGKGLLEKNGHLLTKGYARVSDVVVTSAKGSWVFTGTGEKYLDFSAGFGVVNTGHAHPKVVRAIQEQAAKAIHIQTCIYHNDTLLQLLPELYSVMPHQSLDTFFFSSSGSEATEAAMKLARHATGKQNIIVMQGGYHGRTVGAMSMTTSKTIYRAKYGPLMAGVYIAPYPYSSQLKNVPNEQMSAYCLDQLEMMFKQQTTPDETAALIMEPVLGEGGYVVPPAGFMREVKKMCESKGVLLIADEVQSGFGRTGRMFATEHMDVVPDIMCMAKGLASGFPMSAIVSRRELMDMQPPGSVGGTYSGNLIGCAAARATLQVFKEERILDNVNARGKQLMAGLRDLQKRFPQISDVRGLGLMVAMEFDASCKPGVSGRMSQACLKNNMFILNTSIFEVLRFMPPLTVTKDEVDKCLEILSRTLADEFHA